MTTRKKPQQQLACYFDELLTELEETIEETVIASSTLPETKDSPTSSADHSSTLITSSASVVEDNSSSIKNDTTEKNTIENDAPNTLSTSMPPPIKNESPSFSTSTVTKSVGLIAKAQLLEDDRDLLAIDLREREKQKLEKLLNTLTPIIDTSVSVDVPTVTTVDIPSIPVSDVAKETEAVITPEEKSTIIEDVELDKGVSPIAGSNILSAHQWQPLAHEWLPNERPAWAENTFDILLVDVNDITLAMPLESLDAIYPLEDDLTPLFAQSEWFMGLQKTISGNINIVNTTQFVMPERYDKNKKNNFKYSVAINGSGWGLAVDCIHQPVSVHPDDIRWRKLRAARPWMAGTVKEHMCVLLDIPSLANLLKSQDRNRQ